MHKTTRTLIENLRMYIMVHGGIDRHDRLLDLEELEIRLGVHRPSETVDTPDEVEEAETGGWDA